MSKSFEEEQLKAAFEIFDADGNGHITGKELVNCVRKCFELNKEAGNMDAFTEDDVKEASKEISDLTDKNKDGKITWAEFKSGMLG